MQKIQSKENLIKAIIEELDSIPEKYLPDVYEVLCNFRIRVASGNVTPEKPNENKPIDEIKKVEEQRDQLWQDKSGKRLMT